MIPDNKLIYQLVKEAIAVGAAEVLKEIRPADDFLTINKAEGIFKAPVITKLLQYDLIHVYMIGMRKFLKRSEISQALCESSVQLLFIRMHNGEQEGKQPTTNKRRVGILLGRMRKTGKGKQHP